MLAYVLFGFVNIQEQFCRSEKYFDRLISLQDKFKETFFAHHQRKNYSSADLDLSCTFSIISLVWRQFDNESRCF
jgi:ATP adenylyltransferase/5',5'''-P-1,P-4-tetraphosphate phosphorylase II